MCFCADAVKDLSKHSFMESMGRIEKNILYDQQELAWLTLNSLGDGVLAVNLEGQVSYLNTKAELMTGWLSCDAVGLLLSQVFKVIDVKTRKAINIKMDGEFKNNNPIKLLNNRILINADGLELPIEYTFAPIHSHDLQMIGGVIVFHDATDSRALMEKMTYLAQHDVLTGLPNRSLLTERVTRALGMAKRNKKQAALLFLDVDNFKKINDSMGHAIGDKLLQSVAKRLTYLIRTTDTLCRQGGDEFVILLTEIEHNQDAYKIAKKIITAFSSTHRIDGLQLPITLSIGASVYPDDSNNVDTMFSHADAAMYHAKACGRNNVKFFNEI